MLAEVLERRSLSTLFQPIFSFGESRLHGFEALVRGPEGSRVETPFELFGAAQREGRLIELNIVCIQEVLRAFAQRALPGTLFLNISPQLIVQKGFDQARAARFLAGLGLRPERVVIELTEDYPTYDFRLVHESLMLYRAMGFRVAIDDLGEGFASLRLWSELKPEFVKADKHFVAGIAKDAVKVQFLRAIQDIAESCGSRPRSRMNFAARSWLKPRCMMSCGEMLRKRLPSTPMRAKARSTSWMQTMLSSTEQPSSCAAAKSWPGVCRSEPCGPRTSASWPTIRPSRKPKIGWNSVVRLRSSRIRRSCSETSRRIWLTCSLTRAPRRGPPYATPFFLNQSSMRFQPSSAAGLRYEGR